MVYLDHFIPIFVDSGERAQTALSVVTPPPAIYRGFSTLKKFWEEKFAPENMKSCGSVTGASVHAPRQRNSTYV